MKNFISPVHLSAALLLALLWASPSWAEQSLQAEPTHTLIDTVEMTTYSGMTCELAVAMSVDRSEVRIIRLDTRKGTYNANYFAQRPQIFGQYGKPHILANELDLKGHKVMTVQSSVDFDKDRKDVILNVRLENDEVLEKRIRIEQDFFKDNSKKCLK